MLLGAPGLTTRSKGCYERGSIHFSKLQVLLILLQLVLVVGTHIPGLTVS